MIQPLARRVSLDHRTHWAACMGGGLAIFGAMTVALPSAGQLVEMQALNRELGKLCSNPPHQALVVCRLHARLVSSLPFG